MFRRECFRGHAEENARSIRHIRGPFAFEIGQQNQAIRPRPRFGDGGIERLDIQAEVAPHHFGGHGRVHGAKEGQPAIGRVAEGGDFSGGIDHGFVRAAVDSAAGAETCSDDARPSVARADGAHHVVAAARADQHIRAQAERLGGGGPQATRGLVA